MVLALLGEPPDDGLDPALRAAIAADALAWAGRAGRPFALDGIDDVAAALGGHDGPVLLVAGDVPRLDDELAAAALGDLAAGCILSFAPATDGKPFLVALSSARRELLDLFRGERRREAVFARTMALGGEVGLLRSERRVVTPADARALALDPMVPEPLRALAARH